MAWRRFPRWLRVMWIVAVPAATVIVLALLWMAVSHDAAYVNAQALWEQQGISDYQITIVADAPPAPVVGMKLTIRGGQIVAESILACDEPVEDDWARDAANCDRIRTYYTYMGRYTVEKLFDAAYVVTYRLQSDGWVSTVEYDPVYGYPRKLTSYNPNVFDGFSSIEVREFRPLPAS